MLSHLVAAYARGKGKYYYRNATVLLQTTDADAQFLNRKWAPLLRHRQNSREDEDKGVIYRCYRTTPKQ